MNGKGAPIPTSETSTFNRDSYRFSTFRSKQRRSSKIGDLPDILLAIQQAKEDFPIQDNYFSLSTKLPEIDITGSKKTHSKTKKKRKIKHGKSKHLLRQKWKRVQHYNKRETKNMQKMHEMHLTSDIENFYQFLQPNTNSLNSYVNTMRRGKRTNKSIYPNLSQSDSTQNMKEQNNNNKTRTNNVDKQPHLVPMTVQLLKLPSLQRLKSVSEHTTKYNKKLDERRKAELLTSASIKLLDSEATTDEYIQSVISQVRRKNKKHWKTVIKKLGGPEKEYNLEKLRKQQARRETKLNVLNKFRSVASSLIVPEHEVYRNAMPSELRDKFMAMHRANTQLTFDTISDWMMLQKFFDGWKLYHIINKKKREKVKNIQNFLESKSITRSVSYSASSDTGGIKTLTRSRSTTLVTSPTD